MAKKDMSKTEYSNNLAREAKTNINKFGDLYDIYIDQIFNYFFYRTNKNKPIAEDLTSSTFEKILNNIDKFDSTKANFATWLYSIAQNNLTDHYRKNGRREVMSLENKTRSRPQNSNSTSEGKDKLVLDEIANSNKDADSDVIKDRNLRILNKALCKLSPKDQKVLTLKYIHQLTYKEIGEITQSTVNAVGVRLSRALKRLHRILEEKDLIKKLDIEKNIK